jgi:hypothetical protein
MTIAAVMGLPVDFNCKVCARAEEVQDVRPRRMLAPKSQVAWPLSKFAP